MEIDNQKKFTDIQMTTTYENFIKIDKIFTKKKFYDVFFTNWKVKICTTLLIKSWS